LRKLPAVAGGQPQSGPRVDSLELTFDEERERLVGAITKATAEQGYAGITVADVTRHAGVSRSTFYRHFRNKQQCLLAAYDLFFERLWSEVASACDAQQDWPAQVKAALTALLEFLVDAMTLARVFAVEAATAGLAAAERQVALTERFASLLRSGRRHYPEAAAALPDTTEQALTGGIASIISGRLLAEEPQALSELEPELLQLLLTPYIGVGAARDLARA
jgi:AcrR family transcriptional regulator